MKTRISKKLMNEIRDAGYIREYWEDFDYNRFNKIIVRNKTGRNNTSYADLIIMADTETSRKSVKPILDKEHYNHVCAWSCAFRTLGMNICTLWGKRPSDLPRMLSKVKRHIDCTEMYVYFHNLPYDWVFLRKFFFSEMQTPERQLNVKSLYPIRIQFENGIILKDSLILSQRSLEKWGHDMNVEHAKAVGKWDYDLIRNFDKWYPDEDELLYMECDVLCGVECIDATMKALHKTISSIPLTATGIPRGECRLIGKKNHAHDWFLEMMPTSYSEQMIFEILYHGGYTHSNRHVKGIIFPGYYDMVNPFIYCYDFSSSYPFVMIARKFPHEKFWHLDKPVNAKYIIDNADEYAFIIHLTAFDVELHNMRNPMPCLSYSKCINSVNVVSDNGRIVKADYIEIYVNEMDFMTIYEQYDFGTLALTDIQCSHKDYLPRWFTDYVYERYKAKTELKGVDDVLYRIEKAKVNALYGMSAQRPVKEDIIEDYDTGVFLPETDFDYEDAYQTCLKNYEMFLPYCIGVWVTSYAQYNLFKLGACVPENEIWLYSDTDSVYATGFNTDMVKAYNDKCIKEMADRGYHGVEHDGKIYYLGVAEEDGTYMQFKTLHSKCYCKRPLKAQGDNFVMGDDLQITVAGVPKRGAKSLHNNIDNFVPGFIFDGETSKKLQHTHWFIDEIYTDEHGNETGDSIELSACDYQLNDPNTINWAEFEYEEVTIPDYEDQNN